MHPKLESLHSYPFEKLRQLKEGISPPADKPHIALSIGEPKHEPPAFVLDAIKQGLASITNYPLTKGSVELRQAISHWAVNRFKLKRAPLDPEQHILPVNGTREGLFAFVQAAFDFTSVKKKILMPNPFYQIYEGAAILAGADIEYINCIQENGYQPDFASVSEASWKECQLLFICSPGNPSAKVLTLDTLLFLIEKSKQHDFIIVSDECYSELYFDEQAPPPGLLEACELGEHHDFKNCVVFHSLSKRSNLPGLRSGFIAGDKNIIANFLLYRTYHGCAMALFSQIASIAAWQDEAHVVENRALYREKFQRASRILADTIAHEIPVAGFYFWLRVPGSDTEFTRNLFAQQNVTVLPGSFLARDTAAGNPGKDHVRIALVASIDECLEAIQRIKIFIENNYTGLN